MQDLTSRVKWMWSLGDYGALAPLLESCAIALADACEIKPGSEVLDVAAGDGNFTVAAAERGARVTATDLTPRMVELGAQRTAGMGLEVSWNEADASQLPYGDATFDLAASTFGAMFAPEPERVARELLRVVRPGGMVAMANYSARGFLGEISRVLESLSAPSDARTESPFAWGDAATVAGRFDGLATSLLTEARTSAFEFESVDAAWEFWERTNPPQAAIKAMLPPEAYSAVVARQLDILRARDQGNGSPLRLEWDWLLVIARK